jgi:peptidoglycan/xylan/chitin deacetylase (PgdA/CDA1 family)
MDVVEAYSPDRSIRGKLRRRLARLAETRPARLALSRPMVSFTFDDAPATATARGAEALEARGVRGTYYIAASLAGRQGPQGRYAAPEEVLAVAAAGHEIACHTFAHLDCGAASQAAIDDDVALNAAVLSDWGVGPLTNFAYPYGDVSRNAKKALATRFDILRGLHHGLIENGCDLNQAPAVGIEGPGGEAAASRWLDRAAARRGWLILYTHDVGDDPSAWGCTPATLDRLIAAAQAKGFDIVTVAQGAARLQAARSPGRAGRANA